MKKRILAMLLCLVMVLCILPMTAYATTEISTVSLSGYKEPVAGKSYENYLALTTGESGVSFHSIDWMDETDDRFLEGSDTFQEGHKYTVQIWMEARDGYAFKCVNDNTPGVTATLDGKKLTVSKAYEYKAFAMVVLSYTFPAVGGSATTPTTPAEHTHTYYDDWRYNAGQHYKNCTGCDDVFFVEAHKGGQATCEQDGVCTVCGYAYEKASEDKHVPDTSKWIARAERYHFHKCTICGAHCDIEDHRWSPKQHSVGAKGHAYQCADCKGYGTVSAHNPGPEATDTTPQTCKDCGYVIAPAKNHTHKLTKVEQIPATCTQPGKMEYYTCEGCAKLFADKDGKKEITEETALELGALGHTASDDWKGDENHHWRVCTACNAVLEETKMAHEMENGKCTTCGYDGKLIPEDTEPTVPGDGQGKEKPDLSWLWIVAVAVAGLAGGIAVPLLIVNSKKKKEEVK